MQGPLFSFLDEMTGAVQGIKSAATGGEFAPAYREGRDLIRGMEEQYRKDYPITATVAPVDGIRLFECRRSRVVLGRALPGAKQPPCATWRGCGSSCGYGLALRLAVNQAAGNLLIATS